jgi:hypothetical protein
VVYGWKAVFRVEFCGWLSWCSVFFFLSFGSFLPPWSFLLSVFRSLFGLNGSLLFIGAGEDACFSLFFLVWGGNETLNYSELLSSFFQDQRKILRIVAKLTTLSSVFYYFIFLIVHWYILFENITRNCDKILDESNRSLLLYWRVCKIFILVLFQYSK